MRPTPERLQQHLDGEHAAVRDRTREWLSRPGNAPGDDLPMPEHRRQVSAWAKALADEGDPAMLFPE